MKHPTTPSSHGSIPGLIPGQIDTTTPPQGWQRILSGERFTGTTGELGLVASAAQPGRVAGCALPAGANTAATPVFVLSDDSGRSWQAHLIPGTQPTHTCDVVADTQQPDIFAISYLTDHFYTYVTLDAGRTWKRMTDIDSAVSGLVDGHLLGTIFDPASHTAHLAEITIDQQQAGWQIIDAGLSGLLQPPTDSIEAMALDAGTPNRVYVALSTGSFGVTLYATTNAGASWNIAYQIPTAKRIGLWTAKDHQVFIEQTLGQNAAFQFFASADSGTTWRSIGLHYQDGREAMFIGPNGQIVTYTGLTASRYHLFTLNPTTGVFTSLGTHELGPGAAIGVVVGGAKPTFLYAKTTDTFALAVPSLA